MSDHKPIPSWVRVTSQLGSALGGIALLVVAVYGVIRFEIAKQRDHRQADRRAFSSAMSLFRDLHSGQLNEAALTVAGLDTMTVENSYLSEEGRGGTGQETTLLLNYFETIGLAARNGWLRRDVADTLLAGVVVPLWNKMAPAVREYRTEMSDATAWKPVEDYVNDLSSRRGPGQ